MKLNVVQHPSLTSYLHSKQHRSQKRT